MTTIQDAMNLYVSTVRKWKGKADKDTVLQAAVSDGHIYVDGQACDYDSVSPNRFANGDVVYVARTEDDNKVVVLG